MMVLTHALQGCCCLGCLLVRAGLCGIRGFASKGLIGLCLFAKHGKSALS